MIEFIRNPTVASISDLALDPKAYYGGARIVQPVFVRAASLAYPDTAMEQQLELADLTRKRT
jgi:hypothetical protein